MNYAYRLLCFPFPLPLPCFLRELQVRFRRRLRCPTDQLLLRLLSRLHCQGLLQLLLQQVHQQWRRQLSQRCSAPLRSFLPCPCPSLCPSLQRSFRHFCLPCPCPYLCPQKQGFPRRFQQRLQQFHLQELQPQLLQLLQGFRHLQEPNLQQSQEHCQGQLLQLPQLEHRECFPTDGPPPQASSPGRLQRTGQ